MLKRYTLKKIAITTLLLIVALILYSYPKDINKHISNLKEKERIIYLIDKNDNIGMIPIEDDSFDKIISRLIEDNENIPDSFKALIPKGTKVLDYKIENQLLKINFSKEFYNVKESDEEKMLESIIYTLTSYDNIDKIMIFVEGEKLDTLPHSKKKLDIYLDRNYGVNKIINISKIKDTSKVTVYYSCEDYYVPVSFITNNESDKVEMIIKNLKTNTYTNSNLSSHLSSNLKLTNYQIEENKLTLNFDDTFFEYLIDGKVKEEVKYVFLYSFYDTLGVKEISLQINNNEVDHFRLANT